MIGGGSIFEAMNAAGVLGNVAADRAGRLTRRIGNVIEIIRRDGARQMGIYQARLDARDAILSVDFENLAHARQFDHYASIDRQRTSRESCAGAARRKE